MDDVKVHYNCSKTAQLQAHAYARGTDIHLAPGQEKHLPHEAWHVVQQKQGRVKPTMQLKGKLSINDDKGLEKEADVMGDKCLKTTSNSEVKQNRVYSNTFKTQNKEEVVQKKDLLASMENGKIGSIYEDWGRFRLTHKSGLAKKDVGKKKIYRFQIDEIKFEENSNFSNYDHLRSFFRESELKEYVDKKAAIPDWVTLIKDEDGVLE